MTAKEAFADPERREAFFALAARVFGVGRAEIGEATAEKMRTARLVVWSMHGIYGAGKDLDETFGLIETAEKAAEIYMKIAHLPLKQTITDEQMHQLEAHFGVKARAGYLS